MTIHDLRGARMAGLAHLLEFTAIPGAAHRDIQRGQRTALRALYRWLQHNETKLTHDQQQALVILRRVLTTENPQ